MTAELVRRLQREEYDKNGVVFYRWEKQLASSHVT